MAWAAIARWVATAGGLGYTPVAPGTVACLPPALLVWALAPSPAVLLLVAGGVAGVGVWAAGREEARVGEHDPRSIVVDEVAGMLVALVGAPPGWPWVVALFFLFRIMDVWKPPPIDHLQRLPGGFGIVTDDLLAGVYAAALVALWRWL